MNLSKYDFKLNLNRINSKYELLYSKYVENKNIVLVGPAQSLMQYKQGAIIDEFDLIVRLNKSLPIQRKYKNYIGSRTDILYNSLNTTDYPGENNINIDFLKENGLKFVICSYPYIKPFDKDIRLFVNHSKYQLPFKYLNERLFHYMQRNMNTRPFTGLCAIIDLLQYNIKSLYITGIDFYSSNYYKKSIQKSEKTLKKNRNNCIHNSNNQIKFLKYLSLVDNRIIIDKTLDNILYHHYYYFLENFKYYLPIQNKNIAFLGIQCKDSIDYSKYDFVISFNKLNIPNLIYIDLKNGDTSGIGFTHKHKYVIQKIHLKNLNHQLLKLNIKNITLELYIILLLATNKITLYNVKFNINQNITLLFLFLIKKQIINFPN